MYDPICIQLSQYAISQVGNLCVVNFSQVLQSAELNLQLSPEEVAAIAEVIKPDRSDQIPYGDFASHAADILVSLYQDQPTSEVRTLQRGIKLTFST